MILYTLIVQQKISNHIVRGSKLVEIELFSFYNGNVAAVKDFSFLE